MQVRREAVDAIVAHARRDSPRECCGLLVGTELEVTEAVVAANVAADPIRRYQVSPVDHFEQIKRCRGVARRGAAAVNVHRRVSLASARAFPEPSPTDLEEAFGEFLYLIAGPVDGFRPARTPGVPAAGRDGSRTCRWLSRGAPESN